MMHARVKDEWLPSGRNTSMGKIAHTHTEITITPNKTHDAVGNPQRRTLRHSPIKSMKSVAASK
jgi:hypothetical protein